jgi:hypothetical protein
VHTSCKTFGVRTYFPMSTAAATLVLVETPVHRRAAERGQPVLHRLPMSFGPLDEQPLLAALLLALVCTVVRTVRCVHPHTGKARAQGEVGALAPFDAMLSATGVIRPLQSRRNPATRRAVVMMA